MAIRVPLVGVLDFSKSKKDRLLRDLIGTKEFQRLNDIVQVSFSNKDFPGVNHTRHEHSLGVYKRADQFCAHIKRNFPKHYNKEKAFELKVKALLHDIGHGPYSHSFEVAMEAVDFKENHEYWTSQIILGDTDIGKLLEKYDPELRKRVGGFFEKEQVETFWDAILTGQFDIDRLDYLARDSYHAGISADVDADYLLQKITLAQHKGKMCIAFKKSARDSIGSFLQTRAKMYNRISHCPQSQASEILLADVFKIVRDALQDGNSPDSLELYSRNAIVKILSSKEAVSLSDYLASNDSQLNTFIDDVIDSKNPLLKDAPKMAKRIRSAKPLYCLDLGEYMPSHTREDFKRVTGKLFEIARKKHPDAIVKADYQRKAAYRTNEPVWGQILFKTKSGVAQLSDFDGTIPGDIQCSYLFSDNKKVISQCDKYLTQCVLGVFKNNPKFLIF